MLASAQARPINPTEENRRSLRRAPTIDFGHAVARLHAIRAERAREASEINALLADVLPSLSAPEPVPANDDFDLDGNPLEDTPEAPAPLARNPKKAAPKLRVSYARDRRNLPRIKGFVPDIRPTMKSTPTGASVGDTLTPSSPSSIPPSSPSTSTQKRKHANDNDHRAPPSWDRTTEIIKGHCYARTVATTGGGLSWTLNLGGKVLKAANDNPKGLKARLHDRLKKALAASPLGARNFLFAVEATPAGRWHLHGIIDAATDERWVVEGVLRRVGGTWNSKHHREAQAHTDVLWGPDGWCRYMRKDAPRTRRFLGVKSVLSVTRGCRARAEALWEATRTAARDQRPLTSRPATKSATPTKTPSRSKLITEDAKSVVTDLMISPLDAIRVLANKRLADREIALSDPVRHTGLT